MTYDQLTLNKYLDLKAVPFEGREDIDYMLDVVGIIFDKTPDELSTMPIMDFSNLCGQVQFLNVPPKPRKITGHRIKIGDWDLQITPTISQMQTNQYIDFQTFVGRGEKGMAAQLSCFLIPVGKRYCDGYDVGQLQKDLGEMSTQTATDLIAFFFAQVESVNRRYVNLLGVDESISQAGEDDTPEDTDGPQDPGGSFQQNWGWIYAVDKVSETMRISWNEVFTQPILETLNVLSYLRDRTNWERAQKDKWRKRN